MISFNSSKGFVTTFLLFFISGTLLIGAGKFSTEHKERNKFYGQHVSVAEEKLLLAKDTFYFDVNSSVIKEQYKLPILAHARKLLKHPELKIYINGYTDNTGTIAYNFKLGMLRAKSVAALLNLNGVDLNKMIVVSYADQLPVSSQETKDQDPAKSARRVKLTYINKDQM